MYKDFRGDKRIEIIIGIFKNKLPSGDVVHNWT